MRLVLLGLPGAGKGTQAQTLAQAHNLSQLSTGDMLRAAVAADTEIGREVKDIMARGDLVPDRLVIDIIGDHMSSPACANGFILDGFPRNVPQAEALDKMLEEKGIELDAVLELVVDTDILGDRINSRIAAQPDSARSDDTETTLIQRIKVYQEQTAELVTYYEAKGLLKRVDGMQEIGSVTQQIEAVLGV